MNTKKKLKKISHPLPPKKGKKKKAKKTNPVAMSTTNIQKAFSKTFPFRMKQGPREE